MPTPEEPPFVDPTPVDVAVGDQTVTVDPSQVFIYAPAILDTNDRGTQRAMQRAARLVEREMKRAQLRRNPANPPSAAPDPNVLVVLPAPAEPAL